MRLMSLSPLNRTMAHQIADLKRREVKKVQRRTSVLLAALIFAVGLVITAATPATAAKGKGWSATVLAEFPSDIAGVEKIKLVELRVEPGAKRENFVLPTAL